MKKRQSVLFAVFCTAACLTWLMPATPSIASELPEGIDKSMLQQVEAYPAVVPDRQSAARPRGEEPECDFEPCGLENLIFDNQGGSSAFRIGTPANRKVYDDINMIGTDRFICKMEFVLGGLLDGGEIVEATMEVRDGNLSPDCPDSPTSNILFTRVVDVPMTNPFNLITLNFNPSILVDSDFIWLGWWSDESLGDTDLSWVISGVPEIGTTADTFVMPSGNGVCTFGAGGDYFFFGGNPVAGFNAAIFATPGPPGACCYRDDDIGGGNAFCEDEVLRGDCLTGSLVNVWRLGDCDNFGTNPPCTVCISDAQACAGATEIVDVCGDAHNRPIADGGDINQGCLQAPFGFSAFDAAPLVPNDFYVVCGTSGNYKIWCQTTNDCAQGLICNEENGAPFFCENPANPDITDGRDNEWYLFELTQDTRVTISATARFPHEIAIMQNGGVDPNVICPIGATAYLSTARGSACSTITVSECLPPGQWIVRYRPDRFTGIPCGTRYRIEVSTEACSLPTGACCDTSPSGCSDLAEVACVGRFGIFDGASDCATVGGSCPGVPPNDTCATAEIVGGPSVSVVYDSTFANNTHMAYHAAGPPDVPDICAIGQPAGAAPAIVADVYYRYTIPTTFPDPLNSDAPTAYTEGVVVLSAVGSTYNSWIVVYGDPNNPGTDCSTAICGRQQVACNQFSLNDPAFGVAKVNQVAHLNIPVGGPGNFQPGDCILIRVGGTGAPPAGRGPGQLNIDLVPTLGGPFANNWGRCCYGDPSYHCEIIRDTGGLDNCEVRGGKARLFTDFNQGDPSAAIPERRAGCAADPCPGPGDACFTALDLNALVGGFSGSVTRAINNVIYYRYTLPASGGVVIDTCGSAGNPKIAVYYIIENSPGTGVQIGDCALSSLIATNLQCTSTFSSATGALQVSTCYGGLNATFNACLCLQIGSHPGLVGGADVYIAVGGPGTSAGRPIFGTSPRDVFDPILTDFAGTLEWHLNVNAVGACFECSADCISGSVPEGPDLICQDYATTPPADTWNGGCSANPPSFEGPTIDFSVDPDPVVICGTAGNYRHPFACTNPVDCPSQAPCSPTGFCIGATPFVARDQDWYRVIVDKPSVLRWELLSAEFASQLTIFGDPDLDCVGLFVLANDEVSFGCAPPDGTPQPFEVSASVCAGTYYLRVTPGVFGGLGDTACDAEYVVRASADPFLQTATCCPGDMNADGKLNGLDIQKWITTLFAPPTVVDDFFGCFSPNYCRADINSDGSIDLDDMSDFVDLLLTKDPCEPLGPACSDPATSQSPFDSTGATLSDLEASIDARAADCFQPLESGEISTVCWWGAYINVGGDGCAAEPDCFRITVLQPADGCSPLNSNRCPTMTPVGTPAQTVLDVSRVVAGGLLTPGGVVTQFFYTATLPVPVSVQAGQCYWLEVVNQTPFTGCLWWWSQSPQGDTRHAFKDVVPSTGTLPTDYTDCSVQSRDLAFSLNLRIAKDGCGKPLGRCCYDPLPLGNVICDITTEEDCLYTRFGAWSDAGVCDAGDPPSPDPECVVGRCCYLDSIGNTQCTTTVQNSCLAVGGLWTFGASCPCPTGRCCLDQFTCLDGLSEVACLDQGGLWAQGVNCTVSCPTGLCNQGTTRCQRPDFAPGGTVQQGGYVSDADNGSFVADNFRPTSSAQQFVNQVCFRGFHRASGCSPLSATETFRITYYANSANLPNTSQIIGGPFDVTPFKSVPSPAEGVAGGGTQFQYEAFHAAVPVTAGGCFWIEIQNTTPDAGCVFFWSTATAGDGDNRAAIRRSAGDADDFPYQLINRDLAFCVGPVNLLPNAPACQTALTVPANNECLDAIHIGSGTAGPVDGRTLGGTRAALSLSCSAAEDLTAPDVYYLWNSVGGVAVFELCALRTTYDTNISIHKTTGLDTNGNPIGAGGCPASLSTRITPVNQSCDNIGCPVGLGTNTLFFQGRQSRRQSTAASVPVGEYLIRITGANTNQSGNSQAGHFRLRVTQ